MLPPTRNPFPTSPVSPHMRVKILPIFFLLLIVTMGFAQTPDVAATLDSYMTTHAELGRFNGSVLVAKDGKILLSKGYGYADFEKRVPYTADTKHEVASITKMFTSMAALMLRDKGKLKLEDSICNYLTDCPAAWRGVTVQHLMRHTSGIPDYEEKLEIFSPKHVEFMIKPDVTDIIIRDAKKLPLDFAPGEKFHYSNTAYIVLSQIVEKVSKQPFNKFIEKKILKPAGMTASGMLNYKKLPSNFAAGYGNPEFGWEKFLPGISLINEPLKKVPQISLQAPAGDAALYSTVDDIYKWSVIMDGKTNKLVSDKLAAEIFTPGLSGYGYGWFIDTSFGKKRYGHTGGLPGYISDFSKIPDEGLTVVIFSNVEGMRLSRVKRDLTAIVFGRPYEQPVKGSVAKLTAEQFAALVGNYKMPDGATMKISKDAAPDSLLAAHVPDQFRAGLVPLSPTEFYVPLAEGRAIFTLGTDGRATKVNLRFNGTDQIGERIPQE